MTRLLSLPIIITAFLFFSCLEIEAAELFYECDVNQGFNFEKDNQDLVGHINYIKIGKELVLKSDLSVADPEGVAGDKVKVFGIVSNLYWKGGYADPILFTSNISTENKNFIATLIHGTMSNTTVEVEFAVYGYDPDSKRYYKAIHSNGVKLKGLIHKASGELDMALDMDQSQEVVSPKNYMFAIGVMPEDIEQQIHLAVSTSDKFVKQWGVTVGAQWSPSPANQGGGFGQGFEPIFDSSQEVSNQGGANVTGGLDVILDATQEVSDSLVGGR